MKQVNGIAASNGIASAKVYKLIEEPMNIDDSKINAGEVEDKLKLIDSAIVQSEEQILNIKNIAIKNLGEEKAQVFEAHISILKDPEIIDGAKNLVRDELLNPAQAINTIAKNFITIFSSMEDAYMKERAADIKDVTTRLIKNILGVPIKDLSLINEEVVIIAHDLTPSETSQLNPQFVKGFATEIGGRTSHSAIMARTLEIPAVVGLGKEILSFNDLENIIINGNEGYLIYQPSNDDLVKLEEQVKLQKQHKEEIEKFINKESISKDGFKTEIVANIGSPKDVEGILKFGGEGVGLFRTEFLYMDSDNWPTEEEQYQAYKTVLESMPSKKVVIRTLDIGGDKHLNYYDFPKEMNPFLGYRAVRLQLDQTEILITQARALIRASKFGKLAIMTPMIATIDEFKQVRKIFNDVEEQLKKENIEYGKYELGIMVEVPSVVEIIDKFAKYVDFFSIGTNDLIQYTFAADRMSENVSYLYQPFNPAILRKIKRTIDASHNEGKWTGICGETAGEPKLAPIYLGMGLDEFSMSATSVPSIRRLISLIDKKEAEALVEKALDMETSSEVIELVDKFFADKGIEIY